jgi:hypothetical protein
VYCLDATGNKLLQKTAAYVGYLRAPRVSLIGMRMFLIFAVASALLGPPLVNARDPGPGYGPRLQAQGEHVKKRPGEFPRERDKRREHDKRQQNKLTDEERRELHRDLDRASREIYRR